MTKPKQCESSSIPSRSVVLALTLCCVLLIPAAGASASGRSIRQAIKSYIGKIDVAEGHVLTALGEYKQKPDPAPVVAALTSSVSVVGALKTKVATQSAGSEKVKKAKGKILKGLGAIIVAYQRLSTAFSEKAPAPAAAKQEAEKSLLDIKHGEHELNEGLKLLKP